MPSQCTLACLGTIVPCHSPTWALAVRRVLLSPPISEKVRIYGSFCFPFSGDNKLFTCEAYSVCRHNARRCVPRSLCGAAFIHVSGGSFAFFCTSCRSHTKKVSFVPFGAKSTQNLSPDTSWSPLNNFTLPVAVQCG